MVGDKADAAGCKQIRDTTGKHLEQFVVERRKVLERVGDHDEIKPSVELTWQVHQIGLRER